MVKAELVVYEQVECAIIIVRSHRVMLDAELAALERFPPDLMFQLAEDEVSLLRCQFATSRLEWAT